MHQLVWHHARESITASHPAIARLGLVGVDVHLWELLNVSEHPHQNTSARVSEGLFFSDAASVNEPLHERVIRGYLLHNTIAREVDS